jgi:tripartite-type tricarboxylate transporter receptor subunit TctC
MKLVRSIVTSTVLAVSAAALPALAETYPARPVRIITPFPPGSGPDAVLRLIGDKLTRAWGQQVVVENRPGGNGFIALQAAKQAAPDGYTLVQVDNYHLVAHPHLYKKLPYDPVRDFEMVSPLFRNYFFVVLPSSSKWRGMADLIADARVKPENLNYGSWFIGSPGHLGAAALEGATGSQMSHIPFKDMNQLYTAVGANDVNWAFGSAASTGALYRAGKVKFLAVAAPRRVAGYADVPTVSESGGPPNFEVSAWIGLLAPRGTSKDVIAKLNKDIAVALADKEVVERFAIFAYEPLPMTPGDMAKLAEAESRKYGEIINRSRISLD